ncbi:hypothetical protein SEPCBS119000_006235 [Sporothrix epigloea]|uniref:CCHC-type domain-containing protein n=1 Tax=Sporothrix epigloea TaxID=1892477 RepID=A0ABP0E370_9PEZI
MVHDPDATTFTAYRDQLLKIGTRLEGVPQRRAPAQGAASYTGVPTPLDPDAMDLRAGKAASSGGPGTSKKYADRECYGCHQRSHIRRNCPDRQQQQGSVPVRAVAIEQSGGTEQDGSESKN